MDFDGSNDYLGFGTTNLPSGNTNVSLSVWVWPTVSEDSGCFGYGSGTQDTTFEIYMYNDSGTLKPAVHYAGGNGGTNLGLTLKGWNHIVATYDQTSSRTYVNGALSVTDAQALTIATTYRRIGIQNYGGTPSEFFDGQIDECAIWNSTLDAAAVTAIYNSGVPIDLRNNSSNYDEYTDNLVGYWRNDGVGIWKDLSGQENDGTETGSPVQVFFPKGTTSERDSQGFPTGPGSFQFKGDNDYINLGNSSGDFSTTVPTISCWVRTASTTSQTIFNDEAANGYCGLFLVYMDASGTILWRRGNSSNTEWGFVSTNTINDGNWHNVVCIDNGSALSVYIDGVSETAASTPGTYESPAVASGRNVAIGVLARDYTSGNFDGNIGSIYLYNRILTQAEVSHNFNVQRDRFGV